MSKIYTFIIFLMFSFAMQIDKASKIGHLDATKGAILLATSSGIAAFWAFIAGILRTKYARDLTQSYVFKVQLVFGVVAILVLTRVLFETFVA